MISFKGKKGLVTGIANQRSIAYGVAKKLSELGAELAFAHGPDPKGRFAENAREYATELGATQVLPLDVRNDDSIRDLFASLDKAWGGLDFMVHSIAFADRADLEKPFYTTGREGFQTAMDVSVYSYVAMANYAKDLMVKRGGGSMVAMSFIGSQLAIPNYNVMGPAKAALESSNRYLAKEFGPLNIRPNIVSAGALKTLSLMGIKSSGDLMKIAGEHSALGRTVTQEEVANATVFLLSDWASGMTGQTVYVDAGFNIMAS